MTISKDVEYDFSAGNAPIPVPMIEEHILPVEEDTDDLTEFIACFRIAKLKDFHATVYWKAGVLNYQYVLCTWTKGGKLIDRQVIAGTFADGATITKSFARIDNDMTIYIISGQSDGMESVYDAEKSTAIEMELLPDGKIVELI